MPHDKKYYLILTSNCDLYDEDGDISIDKMAQAATKRSHEIKEYQDDQNEQTAITDYRNSRQSSFFPQGALVNIIKQSSEYKCSHYVVSYQFFNVDQGAARRLAALDIHKDDDKNNSALYGLVPD